MFVLQMGFSRSLLLVLFSWILFASTTYQLRSYENQILLQLRKHLEYPMLLENWENYNGDLCTLPTTPQMSIKCENDSIIELRIMGSKPNSKVSVFNGYSIVNQTLSQSFNSDSFVTTLARLSNLKVLSLVSLGIYGPLPDKIHRLYSLESIDMSSNFLFGVIPSGMSRMAKLQTFAFDDNFFNDTMPDWLDSLTNLTTLSLKNNRLKGHIPLILSRMRTLNEIVLSHNLLSGKLPDLSGLANLQLLDLRENKLDSELPSLPKGLANVFLSNNSFSGNIPEEFGKLDEIQHLDLSNNFLTGTPPAILFSFPNISYLNLSFNMLGGSLPERLNCGDALSLVDLSNNRLVGQLPSCLSAVNDDRTVSIRGNCFSVVARGQRSLAHCKHAEDGKRREREIAVLAAVIGGIVIVVIIILAVGLCMFCKRGHTKQNVVQHIAPKVKPDNLPSGISSGISASARITSQAAKMGVPNSPSYRIFTMDELEEATMYFDESNLLGEGSSGKVYKGRLLNGSFVAIRSLALSRKHLIRNLKMRLEMLSKLSHPHLVGLLGHCTDGGNMQDELSVNTLFLVYEFVPNGNFHSHLSETGAGKVLKWSDRLRVLIGVAKAVHFLHTGVIPHSYSNKLKTHNILLDNHRIAKLSDYGMYILADEKDKTEGKGIGSKSWHTSKLEDDVYKFGFILLESLVGPITSGKGETYLLNEMASFGSQDGRRKIVDPIVLTTSSQESLSIVVSITNKCISTESSSRPSFEDVLWNLQYAAQVQATADADQKSDSTSLSGHQSR